MRPISKFLIMVDDCSVRVLRRAEPNHPGLRRLVDDSTTERAVMKMLLRSCLLGLCAAFAAAQAAPMLQVNAFGVLTGAKGVTVGARAYDVEFVEGSCVELFSPCTSSTAFAFRNRNEAAAASAALLDSVFLDGPSGMFNSILSLTAGCSFSGTVCDLVTPFGVGIDGGGFSGVLGTVTYHVPPQDGPSAVFGIGGLSVSHDTWLDSGLAYARWSPVPIPEPDTICCLGIAGLVLLISQRVRTVPSSHAR
jgi:hypothetical protein